jgi:N utilization substance protein A
VRIQNITDEVNGERIDVIEWSEKFETMLRETLSPAKIDKIVKHEDEKRVDVYVEEDQRALAIGKNGQNVRLASEIMGWEIDILNTSELQGDEVKEETADSTQQTVHSTQDTEDAGEKGKKKEGEKKDKGLRTKDKEEV